MSRTGDHAEDIEHALDHAGREVGELLVDSVTETDDPAELELLEPGAS